MLYDLRTGEGGTEQALDVWGWLFSGQSGRVKDEHANNSFAL